MATQTKIVVTRHYAPDETAVVQALFALLKSPNHTKGQGIHSEANPASGRRQPHGPRDSKVRSPNSNLPVRRELETAPAVLGQEAT